jgi:hypothetical protein
MANEKRCTVLLDKKSQLKLMLASQGPGDKVLFARFTSPHIPEGVQNYLASMIRTRLALYDIPTTYCREDNHFTFTLNSTFIHEKNNSHVMLEHAKAVMEEVGSLTRNGMKFEDAAKEVYEIDLRLLRSLNEEKAQEQRDADLDEPNKNLRKAITKKDARDVIMRCVERLMPNRDAKAFAEALSTILVQHHPTRPAISKDEILYRGTDEDDLYRLVRNSCNSTIIADEHKRRFAIGELFDALHELYESAEALRCEARERA